MQTIRYVKFSQLYYQALYKFNRKLCARNLYKTALQTQYFRFVSADMVNQSFKPVNSFTFLNLTHTFVDIDWNYKEFGKLWTYNLCYFDFLHQREMTEEMGLSLILDFCSKRGIHEDAYEPYPISLRVINWTKFLCKYQIFNAQINQQLFGDLYKLKSKLEYHLLANHLFENGFALLFGSYYFKDELLYNQAKKIIEAELNEQILGDGAHYELTPMYHQIILYRILDCYQLVSRNSWKDGELAQELKEIAERMLGWMTALQFSDGALPLINDSAVHIAPTANVLLSYGGSLGIKPAPVQLCDSGYRKFTNGNLELFFDAANFQPTYQPGHAHADSLQILLNKNTLPFLVDTGISTYEKNERRLLERSTQSHNTVTIDLKNSSEVWSGFRVGRRARVKILKEDKNGILAQHDGYRNFGIIHERSVEVVPEGILVKDSVRGSKNSQRIEGHLHFHPDRIVTIQENSIFVDGKHFLEFRGQYELQIKDYLYCIGYNELIKAKKIIYEFNNDITLSISK